MFILGHGIAPVPSFVGEEHVLFEFQGFCECYFRGTSTIDRLGTDDPPIGTRNWHVAAGHFPL